MSEAPAFISEIPTGVVADVYSRRLSVIISTFMVSIGFLLMAFGGEGIYRLRVQVALSEKGCKVTYSCKR